MKILLIGLGTVGQAFYELLAEKGLEDLVKYVVVKQADKGRNAALSKISYSWEDKIVDPEIDCVVELIDDALVAQDIAFRSLSLNKHYISANKKMLAENLRDLKKLEEGSEGELLYEAAVAGAIPIVKTLGYYFETDELIGIEGILNGSTNYILEELAQGKSYEAALAQAQALGFAESDPYLDVSGWDATYKLSLLIYLASGNIVLPQSIQRSGINRSNAIRKPDLQLKLIASWNSKDKSKAKVGLEYLKQDHPLARIPAEENAILIHTKNGGSYLLQGKGAGAKPTAWAVYSDFKKIFKVEPLLV